MKTVLLTSSGLDSTCIAFLMKPNKKVYFHLGGAYNEQELDHLPEGTTIDLSLHIASWIQPNSILPRRNALLVLAAAWYGDSIILGTTAGDTTKDKDPLFIKQMNALLYHMAEPDKCPKAMVVVPFGYCTKRALVAQYLRAGGTVDALLRSRSCYGHDIQECGQCRSCVRKYVALAHNEIEVSHLFTIDPRTQLKTALAYAQAHNRGKEAIDIAELIK